MKMKSLFKHFLWSLGCLLLVGAVSAQPICDNFSQGVGNWTGTNADVAVVMDVTTSNGTRFLEGSDSDDASMIHNDVDYRGSMFPCGGQLCWSYKIFDDNSSGTINVNPSIKIYTGPANAPTAFATFRATNITVNENSPWQHNICATIAPAVNGVLPAGWTMGNNGTAAQFNQLIANFTGVSFGTDIDPQAGPTEVIGIDNFCYTVTSCCDATDVPWFTIQTSCNNGVLTVNLTAADTDPANQWWGLYQTNTPVADGGILIAQVGGAGGPATATFTITDFTKFYYIKHGIWDDCYGWREKRELVNLPQAEYEIFFPAQAPLSFSNWFCYGFPITMSSFGSPAASSYSISLLRRPILSSSNVPFVPYANSGTITGPLPSNINLANLFAGLPTPVYFEPNYEYLVRVTIDPTDPCYANTVVEGTVNVYCCDGYLDANFCLEPEIPGGSTYVIRVKNYRTYTNIGAVHEWVLLSSPNQGSGPYTVVTTTTSSQPNFALYTQANYNVYYTVVHRLRTACGDICMTMGVRMESGNGFGPIVFPDPTACKSTPVNCNWIDSILHPCTVPTGLFGSCSRRILVWNPVQGAVGYTVEISYNDPACCRSSYAPVGMRYEVSGSSLPLWSITTPKYDCFRWRVMTRCANGATSAWSEWKCYYCPPGAEDGSTGGVLLRGMVKNSDVETKPLLSPIVSPNPNNGDMTLSLQAPGDLIVSVDVVNAQGSRVTTLARNTYKGGQFNTKLSLGAVAKGVYTVVFNTNYGIFRKKVIVQ